MSPADKRPRRRVRGRIRPAALVAMALGIAIVIGGCTTRSPHQVAATPHPVTAGQAARLAKVEFNAYRDKVLAVKGTVIDATGAVKLTGWVNTVDQTGYALADPPNGTPFLTAWNAKQVAAQNTDTNRSAPPMPRPRTGWSESTLSAGDSVLAAAQVLLISIGKDRPDNPQLLMRNGAKWLRTAHVGSATVDVIAGPLAEGATVSNLRYWVDRGGHLLRLQARLDGHDWSTFSLTPAPDVTF